VILDYRSELGRWTVEQVEVEMKDLVIACGGEVVDTAVIPVHQPTAGLLISEGKAKDLVDIVAARPVDVVIFSYDLKGSQQRNLEDMLHVKTIDRTQLILDIFARQASSQEGKMQVELAQLQYLLPRLSGKGIELSRQGGGIGALGPGETKLEMDHRRISQRIDKLKRNLADVERNRDLKRKQRRQKGVPMISLVGYTNAGKSTLLNALTGAGQKTKDGLFTTLDSLSRQLVLPNNQKVVLSDTVGFMNDLPHHLIESFKATLEEVRQADIIIRVLDISDANYKNRYDAVTEVLGELDSLGKPTITALNKIDRIEEPHLLDFVGNQFDHPVCVSAKNGLNLDELRERIMSMLKELITEVDLNIPIGRMDLVDLAHREGEVYAVKYYDGYINIRASVPVPVAGKLYKYQIDPVG
jgi:GTP-binding protein HflX